MKRKTLFEQEISNALNTLRKSNKALNEGYIFDGEDDSMGYDEGDAPVGDNQAMDKQNLSKYDERIAQIREVAI